MALAETAPAPVYQQIGPKAKHLRELGMSDRAIARALGVDDKTVAKAVCCRGNCSSGTRTG